MSSEIIHRREEIKALAASCKTINDLARLTSWNMETARHANAILSLGLPDAKLRGGVRREAQVCPKPQKKGAGK